MIEPTVLDVTVSSDEVARALRASPVLIDEEMVPAILEAQFLLEREIRENTPTSGAGTLRDSIGSLPITFSPAAISAEVGTALAYAQPVETGSRPHRPPVEPLAEWVQRKLGKSPDEAKGIAWAIAGKIAKEGSKGVYMFREGLAQTQGQILEILGGVRAVLDRIALAELRR